MKDVVCPVCGSLMREIKPVVYLCPKCGHRMDLLNYRNIREEK
jgi:DNA-directed RNA polymerase subunit RPC12/RpoP